MWRENKGREREHNAGCVEEKDWGEEKGGEDSEKNWKSRLFSI